MAFQIDEKLISSDRALITRNKKYTDLLGTDALKFKPGMIHYTADSQKLWLSVDPYVTSDGKVEKLVEISLVKPGAPIRQSDHIDIALSTTEPRLEYGNKSFWYEVTSQMTLDGEIIDAPTYIPLPTNLTAEISLSKQEPSGFESENVFWNEIM